LCPIRGELRIPSNGEPRFHGNVIRLPFDREHFGDAAWRAAHEGRKEGGLHWGDLRRTSSHLFDSDRRWDFVFSFPIEHYAEQLLPSLAATKRATFCAEQKSLFNQCIAMLHPEISREYGGLPTGTFGTEIKGRPCRA
jgi:hypothetical protein